MTVLLPAGPILHPSPPRMVCPSQVDLGDLIRLPGEHLPVVLVGSELVDVHRVWSWVSPITTTTGHTPVEGKGVHDAGERVILLGCGETVRADQLRDGDLLVLEGRTSLWGVVVGTPRESRPGVLDVAWRAGSLPSGGPATVGFAQWAPHQMVRRAAKAGVR